MTTWTCSQCGKRQRTARRWCLLWGPAYWRDGKRIRVAVCRACKRVLGCSRDPPHRHGHCAMTPSQLLHAHHGSEPHADCTELPRTVDCYVCAAATTRGAPVDGWMGSLILPGRTRSVLRTHVRVCGVRHRDGWQAADDRAYVESSLRGGRVPAHQQGDKPAMRAWLRRPHPGACFAAIADSGQKHLIPWAPVCHDRVDVVNFEDRIVEIGDWQLVDDLSEMLTLGATKEEISRGEYSPRAWQPSRRRCCAITSCGSAARGGGWFDLALWLAQRDEARAGEDRC